MSLPKLEWIDRFGRSYMCAAFYDAPPTAEEIRALTSHGAVQGILLRGSGVSRHDLAWLDELPELQLLEINSSTIPTIPEHALGRLESFEWIGRSTQVIDVGQLSSVRGLTVGPTAKISGSLADCAELRDVALSGYDRADLSVLDGCARLERAKVQCVRQSLTFGWVDPPRALRWLDVSRCKIDDLNGIGRLESLENLYVDVGRAGNFDTEIDVRPLLDCQSLKWVEIGRAGYLTHVDALGVLPSLKRFTVVQGKFSPADVSGVPLSVSSR